MFSFLSSPLFFDMVNTLNYKAVEWKYCSLWGWGGRLDRVEVDTLVGYR